MSRLLRRRSRGRGCAVATVLSVALLAACVAPPASPPTPAPGTEPVYEIVVQDVVYSGGDEPAMLAISGEEARVGSPAGLPPDVVADLQATAAEDAAALYVVVYAGMKPGGGYAVAIESVSAAETGEGETLVVTYRETAPEFGGTTALTYPYTIARITSPAVSPDQVRFEEQAD